MDWSHVDSWLSSVFKGNPSPNFERTNDSFQLINTLKNLNFNSMPLIQHILMNKLHFKLSNDSEKAIDSLALLAESLGMDTIELSNYYTAVSKLTMDRMELQHESLKLDEMEYMLAESQKKADDELSLIKSMLLNLQQGPQETAVQRQQIGEKEILSSEYSILQKKYDELGVQESTLTKIQELENKADAAELQCKHQEMKLESFTSLPSDMVLASIKIQEAEDDLHRLEQVRENLLSEIADSVH
ncbi:Kinesin- motor protein [Mucor velutinosus]|uniref:Kinesin- motor protein n=1 Tax=Mucor velutinosus TaxID=708070 RepID=A0AAN7DPS3_9FUNG|nr:Kinesin- motor protein [Mucor velutinosus]